MLCGKCTSADLTRLAYEAARRMKLYRLNNPYSGYSRKSQS